MLQDNERDPEKLNDLFIQITDDLSYARTFYPNRSVRMFLNSLAQRIFHNIYRGKRFPKERLWLFWADELPRVIWASRQAMLLSLSIFLLAFGIGILSSIINPDFARVILGDDYVEMTLANIEDGDPMGVYKDSRPLGMSVGIAANNLFVALRTAIFGVLASIGTVFIMLYNGIMVGAFQYFFIERGLFLDSFLTIWTHGTLEISAIIIAGGAGLVAGSGLLFPDTYTRSRAFQISMRKGMKIMIGLTPVIVLAAFIEGFLTRYTQTPDLVRGFFIFLCLGFVLWYFVWLPWYVAHRKKGNEPAPPDLPPDRTEALEFQTIKSSGEVFSDVFTLLGRYPRSTWGGMLGAATLFVLLVFVFSGKASDLVFAFPTGFLGIFSGAQNLFDPTYIWYILPLQVVLMAAGAYAAYQAVEREMPPALRTTLPVWRRAAASLALLLPATGMALLMRMESGFLVWLVGMMLLPMLGLLSAILYFETANPFRAFFRLFALRRIWSGATIGFLSVNLGLLMLVFLDSGIWNILLSFFSWLVPPGEGHMQYFFAITTAIAIEAVLLFVFLLVIVSGAMQYFSLLEIAEARNLRERISTVGTSRRIRGLARE